MSIRLHPLEDPVSDDPESTRPVPSRVWLQRLSFVLVLMGLGAITGAVVASRTPVRYEAEAIVALSADASPSSFVDQAEQTTFGSADGTELQIVAAERTLLFVVTAEDPSVAASRANAAASAFVDASNDSSIRLGVPADPTDTPISPNRLTAPLIGVVVGALIGLTLQAALRPQTGDDAATYVPTWTDAAAVKPIIAVSPEQSTDQASEAPGAQSADTAGSSAPSRPLPLQQATLNDEAASTFDDDPALARPMPRKSSAQTPTIGATSSGIFGSLLIAKVDLDAGASSADENSVDDLPLAAAVNDEEQLDELSATISNQQSSKSNARLATGDAPVEQGFTSLVDASEIADSPVAHVSLALDEDQADLPGGARFDDQPLSAETDFLRSEVARYQDTLDAERVAHATALATAQLEHQEALDRIHRQHRTTLNQLAHTNRNVLTTQRSEADNAIAALESKHQVSLETAHADYEERLRKARTHLSERLGASHQRAVAESAAEHDAELAAVHEQLDAATLEQQRTQEQLDALLDNQDKVGRETSNLKLRLDHSTRIQSEERRRLELRIQQLEDLVARSEERLAQERERTSVVVRNLLQESATSAAEADWARERMVEGQRVAADSHEQTVATLIADAKLFERAAAQREAELEATISSLLARNATETSAPESP